MEEWKEIEGYEGYYEVSSLGRVRSIPRAIERSDGVILNLKSRIRKTVFNYWGYERVPLALNCKKKTYSVHRLVAKTFLANTKNKKEVNHIDGNKANNCVENLEWSTRKENQLHACSLNPGVNKGSRNSRAKLTEHDLIKIKELREQHSYTHKKLGEMFGVGESTISMFLRGQTWQK